MNKKIIAYIILVINLFAVAITALPLRVYADFADDFSAKAMFLMEYETGTVLFEKNAKEKLPVASIVKLMTIELVCEAIEEGKLSLDEIVIASEHSAQMGGSQVFIEENGEYTAGDLLKSCIVSSANDASVALAEKIAGSEENFVVLMNKKAKELGMKGTNYVNATGLPASGQFSCAKDTAKLLKLVSSHQIYHKYSTIWMDTLTHPHGRETELVNTNKLIRYYEGCDGGKTGSTSEAGYCLAATAKRGNMRLIGVVLGAENGKKRFSETSQLLNYGFSNFENKKLVDSAKEYSANVSSGKQKTVSLHPQNDLFAISKKTDDKNYTVEIKIPDSTKAPISVGQQIGKIYLIKNGVVVNSTDLVAANAVEEEEYIDMLDKVISNWAI